MKKTFTDTLSFKNFSLWKKNPEKRIPYSFSLEITPRCNNNCRHCYINLPAYDKKAIKEELSLEELKNIADEALSLGALWVLITGGEPLLRDDFADIYLYMKKKGLLVSVFTNASLINKTHAELFKKYPPRDIEVTVYGVTEETYEQVTGNSGSFSGFQRGLKILFENNIKVRLKAMGLKSNFHEFVEISDFCRKYTGDYFRFDPFLHLRYDGNTKRNEDIKGERLSADEISELEKTDSLRFSALEKKCSFLSSRANHKNLIFLCGAGTDNFSVSYNGMFRLCSSLCRPDCVYNLRKGNLTEAWYDFVTAVKSRISPQNPLSCYSCRFVDICMWCPAVAYLEGGCFEAKCDYFCEVAAKRFESAGGL